jgi:HEAT repeat protein
VKPDDSELSFLLGALADRDVAVRQRARHTLAALGKEVVPGLCEVLEHGSFEARWEAALALGEIGDPAAAPSLVAGLRDKEPDVRWLAAEGLARIGRPAVPALLQGLIAHGDSFEMRQAAHHMIHDLKDLKLRQELAPLMQAFSTMGNGAHVVAEAGRLWRALRLDEQKDQNPGGTR